MQISSLPQWGCDFSESEVRPAHWSHALEPQSSRARICGADLAKGSLRSQ